MLTQKKAGLPRDRPREFDAETRSGARRVGRFRPAMVPQHALHLILQLQLLFLEGDFFELLGL